MKRLTFFAISSLIIAGLTSCVQRYDAPPLNTPKVESWKSQKDQTTDKTTAYADCPDPEQVLVEASFRPWWKVFNDPKLDELEYQAIKESPKVQQAIGRLESAMAVYGITRASLFPQISLDVSVAREKISPALGALNASPTAATIFDPSSSSVVARSPNAFLAPTAQPCVVCPPPPAAPTLPTAPTPKPKTLFTTIGVLPVLTYNLDFWGKNWQATESAMQQVKAEQEDLQNSLLQLTTALADTYLQTRTYDSELDILERTLVTRQKNYDLNKTQFDAGLINDLAVEQAKSDLESVAAEIQNTSKLRSNAEHYLADLVGQPASTFTLERRKDLPILPNIAAGVPSTMLQRRPDIRQSLALIQSAALNVGVAKTEYFPDFNITLDYGFISNKAKNLFKWKNHTWLAAIDAITPIFTAGKIASTIEHAISEYKQSVASYLDTVLGAFQQVEDALFNIEATKKQLMHLKLDVIASKKAYDIADKRYRMGLEAYLFVVNTERTLLDAERVEIQVTREQFSNTISLINSLGGYWNNENQRYLSQEHLSSLTK